MRTLLLALLIVFGCEGKAKDKTESNVVVVNGQTTKTDDSPAIVGSGVAKTEQRPAGAFTSVDLDGSFDCDVTVGGAPAIEVSGDDNLLSQLETTIDGDKLHVRTHGSVSPKTPLRVKLTTAELKKFFANGASKVAIRGIAGESFSVRNSGTGSFTLVGSVQQLSARVAGTAVIDANGLTADAASVTVDGTASIEVGATKNLAVTINGTGSVRYAGQPNLTKRINGTGTVTAK